MTNSKTNLLTSIVVAFSYLTLHAQNEVKPAVKDSTEKSYFKTSVSYLSNNVYNGRRDSLTVPYMSLSVEYSNKLGFNISANVNYNPNNHHFDMVGLDAGYSLSLIKDKLSCSVDASKYFYSASSTSIKSGSKGSLDADVDYDFDIASIDAGAGVDFSNKLGIMSSLAINHEFEFDIDNSKWTLTPTATANFGTQNLYQAYLSKIAKKKDKSIATATTSGNNKITLLDYEMSLPIAFDAKMWGISLTPTYAIPENPITTTTTTTTTTATGKTKNKTTTVTEKLSNVFYGKLVAYLKF